MTVKWNGCVSKEQNLNKGGPQGALLGIIEYLSQNNDLADFLSNEEKFKYIDDLSILDIVCLAGLLTEYEFNEHVASDVGTDQLFLPPSSYKLQEHLNTISDWTDENLMKISKS